MRTYAFTERTPIGTTFYIVKAQQLQISGRRFLKSFEMTVDLREVSPRIERLIIRFTGGVVCFLIGMLFAAVTVVLIVQQAIPPDKVLGYAYFTGGLALYFLRVGIPMSRRLEIVRLRNMLGGTLFDMIREKKYADEFDEFVENLRTAASKSKERNSTPEIRS